MDHTRVDPDEARQILREQARKAQDELRLVLARHASQVEAVIETLIPWLNCAWVRDNDAPYHIAGSGYTGRIKRGAYEALRVACNWAEQAEQQMETLASGLKELEGYLRNLQIRYGNIRSLLPLLVQAELFRFGSAPLLFERDVDSAFQSACSLLEGQVRYVRESPPPRFLIDIPEEFHPPRYGHLNHGVLARLFAEDLATQISKGRALERSLAARTETWHSVVDWVVNVINVIDAGAPQALQQDFRKIMSGVTGVASSLITERDLVCQAYVALALAYLNELQERMPDYAEAAGQVTPEPRTSVTISGGTFHVGQLATDITNIDSENAGVVYVTSPDLAEALEALRRAVLSQSGLDNEQRQNLLNNVDYLAQTAHSLPEKRDRGAIKTILSALKIAAISGGDLSNAMTAWGAVLHKLLSLC